MNPLRFDDFLLIGKRVRHRVCQQHTLQSDLGHNQLLHTHHVHDSAVRQDIPRHQAEVVGHGKVGADE